MYVSEQYIIRFRKMSLLHEFLSNGAELQVGEGASVSQESVVNILVPSDRPNLLLKVN